MPTPKKALLSIEPRWWDQTQGQAAKLASNSARVSNLMANIAAGEVDPKALPVLMSLLEGFSDLAALLDGTSTYLIKGGPGVDPADLVGIAKAYLAGQVKGDDVIAEQVWDYGDGPDALPDAIESVAKRLRKLPPEKRKAAQVFVLLEKDAGEPTGAQPKAG